jgi:IMP dehydrogenase
VRWVKKHYPQVDVIGGNIATGRRRAGAGRSRRRRVKVGIGPGSICTTRIVAGVGVPQIMPSTTWPRRCAGTGVPLIADGGIRYSGDIAKAIAAGATRDDGRRSPAPKRRRARPSCTRAAPTRATAAWARSAPWQQGSADRYFQDSGNNPNTSAKLVPEGIEGPGALQGLGGGIIFQMAGGLRASMHYCGCASIDEMQRKAEFVEITTAGMRESHVHDVQITKEAPNYRME